MMLWPQQVKPSLHLMTQFLGICGIFDMMRNDYTNVAVFKANSSIILYLVSGSVEKAL